MSARRFWIAVIAGLLLVNLVAVATLIVTSHRDAARVVPGYAATAGKSP